MSNIIGMQGMLYRTLGTTGEKVSAIGIGGWHIGLDKVDEQLSIRIIRTAVDRGINFMDNCWDYNGGASEIRMGKALRDGYRDRVVLMTKIDGRSRKEAERQLDQSLRRLQGPPEPSRSSTRRRAFHRRAPRSSPARTARARRSGREARGRSRGAPPCRVRRFRR